MMVVISFFSPLCFILGITLFNSVIFKERFERVLVLSLLEIISLTYLLGFIDMRMGLIISILVAIFSIPLCIYASKKDNYSLKSLFFTDLFYSFLFLFMIIFVWNIGKRFHRWDEFTHWGVMAKEMFRLDQFYCVEDSVLQHHKEYPPFVTVFQYIWCKLCGEYKERHLYSAKIILSLATFFPVYSWIVDKKEKFDKGINKYFKIIIIPLIFVVITNMVQLGEASYYRTIYMEGALCSLVFYAFFSLFEPFQKKWLNCFNIILAVISVLLTKQMGIYFFAVLFVGYLFIKILDGNAIKTAKEIFLIAGVPMIFFVLWKKYSDFYVSRGQFDSSRFPIKEVFAFLKGNGEVYQYQTTENLLTAILRRPLMTKPFSLSYAAIVLGFLGIIAIFYYFYKRDFNIQWKKKYWGLNVLLILAAIGYIPVMLILYFFGFNDIESVGLVCYERYLTTMIFPVVLVGMIYVFAIVFDKGKHIFTIIMFAVVVLVTAVSRENFEENIVPGIFCDNISDVFIGDASIIKEVVNEEDKVFLICQGDIGGDRNIITYLVSPIKTNLFYYNLTANDRTIFVEEIKSYDYLYLSEIDDKFIDAYGDLFEDKNIKKQQLYKIHSIGKSEIFERVY